MKALLAATTMGLALLFTASSEVRAQYADAAPVGVRRLEPSAARRPARSDSGDVAGIPNLAGGVIVGTLGAVGGGTFGAIVGVASAKGCHGEECGLGSALVGFAIGESIGMAMGTYIGTGGHGNVALTSAATFGILVAGVITAREAGEAAVLLIPAAQLVTALAMAQE